MFWILYIYTYIFFMLHAFCAIFYHIFVKKHVFVKVNIIQSFSYMYCIQFLNNTRLLKLRWLFREWCTTLIVVLAKSLSFMVENYLSVKWHFCDSFMNKNHNLKLRQLFTDLFQYGSIPSIRYLQKNSIKFKF